MSMFHVGDLVLHKKTGNVYTVIDIPTNVRIEAGNVPAYVYRAITLQSWVRPQSEMEDGRFELYK